MFNFKKRLYDDEFEVEGEEIAFLILPLPVNLVIRLKVIKLQMSKSRLTLNYCCYEYNKILNHVKCLALNHMARCLLRKMQTANRNGGNGSAEWHPVAVGEAG